MFSSIVVGNATQTLGLETKGWVVGHMQHGPAYTPHFEIKIWHYDSQPNYGWKRFMGTEFIIVEGGMLTVELEIEDGDDVPAGKKFELKGSTREYIIISPPNCKKRVLVTEAPAYGVTVRWPSAPGMNVEC